MNSLDIDQIVKIIVNSLQEIKEVRLEESACDLDCSLIGQYALDSVEIVGLIINVENKLGYDIHLDQIMHDDLISIRTLAMFVQRQQEGIKHRNIGGEDDVRHYSTD